MIQDLRFKNKYEAGQAMMVATVFFLALSLTIIFGLASPIVKQQKVAAELLTSRQSYFLAEAGVEDVVYRLDTGQPVGTSEVLSLANSSATTLTTDTAKGKLVAATGDVRDSVRKVRAELVLGTGVAFHYGVQVGAGGFVLSNNAGVNGNIYSNANVTGQNGSFVTGDAFAVGNVTGVDVGGTTQTGVSPQDFPITDEEIQGFKDEAAAGGTVGNQTLSGANNTLGPKKIQGNLTLSNGAKLSVTGTLWVTGNIVVNNNAEIVLSAGYGSTDGVIVVDGTSTLSNGASFDSSGTEGSYIMLLSTNSTGSAIVLSNNAGAVILYAPNGTVQLSNNADVQQITAKTISLSNGAVINYEQGLIDAAFSSGPGGGYEILEWKEIE